MIKPELYDSEQDPDRAIKIFRLTRMENLSLRGARYYYEARDGCGRRLGICNDNREFVAGIVGRHKIRSRPREHVYSLTGLTQTPANLGRSMTSGGRAAVYGIALIETVLVGSEMRPAFRNHKGGLVGFGDEGSGIDWNELPAEFRRPAPFLTEIPAAGGVAADWIYSGRPSFTDARK